MFSVFNGTMSYRMNVTMDGEYLALERTMKFAQFDMEAGKEVDV